MQPAQADDDHGNLPVHPDCVDNSSPHVCSEVIAELKPEFALINRDFNPPNVDQILKYYHPQIVHYVGNFGRWFRGHDDFKNNFLIPFAATVPGASLDFSPYRFQVINPNLVITYGALPGVIHLKNGATIIQNPLPQTVTWVRNPKHDPERPFVVLADHE